MGILHDFDHLNDAGRHLHVYLRYMQFLMKEKQEINPKIRGYAKIHDQMVELDIQMQEGIIAKNFIKTLQDARYLIKEISGDTYIIYLLSKMIELSKSGDPQETDIYYKKREFCKAMDCDALELMEIAKEKNLNVEIVKRLHCKKTCPFTAWEFHDWLQENGFIIMKKENND